MIRHAWTVIAQQVFVDGDTNRVAVIPAEGVAVSVAAQRATPTEPFGIPMNIELLSLWWRSSLTDEAEFESRISIMFNEAVLETYPVPVRFNETLRARSRVRFESVLVRAAGAHIYRVELRRGDQWETVAEVPLDVAINVLADA